MTFEVLISTMNDNLSLLDKMKINTDCVVINQCSEESVSIFTRQNHQVIWINSKEKGLSKSRNLALRYSKADILLLADNDEIFEKNLDKLILQEFKNGKNQLVAFNIESIGGKRKRFLNKKYRRLNVFNIFRYGSARIAFRRQFVLDHKIVFNEMFGAGTPFGSGEDSIFLNDFLKNKGRCISSPVFIAKIDDSSSTWFAGFTNTYFYNIGFIFYELFSRNAYLYIVFYLFKHFSRTKVIGLQNSFKNMKKGYNENKKRHEITRK